MCDACDVLVRRRTSIAARGMAFPVPGDGVARLPGRIDRWRSRGGILGAVRERTILLSVSSPGGLTLECESFSFESRTCDPGERGAVGLVTERGGGRGVDLVSRESSRLAFSLASGCDQQRPARS